MKAKEQAYILHIGLYYSLYNYLYLLCLTMLDRLTTFLVFKILLIRIFYKFHIIIILLQLLWPNVKRKNWQNRNHFIIQRNGSNENKPIRKYIASNTVKTINTHTLLIYKYNISCIFRVVYRISVAVSILLSLL